MTETTKSRKRYVKAWEAHLEPFHTLRFTPSRQLSEEVNVEIHKFKELIRRVAVDKGLK